MFKQTMRVLSIATLAAATAACGSTAQPTPNNSANPGEGGTAAKPELRALLQYSRFDANAEFVAKYLNEATGYKTTYDMLPVENFDEKLNLLMANREPYSFMKLNATQYAKLASSGALEPLDELINKYGTNMKNVISEASWNGAKLDGKVYGIPETGSGSVVNTALITRQDWFDELGLQMPKNRDDFYSVLKTIREKKNVIPLSGGKSPMVSEVAAMFGVSTSWYEKDGKLMHLVENPGTKEYLAFMKKLYDEKLIDPEWALNQSNKVIENFTSGKAAIISNGWFNMPTVKTALAKNFPNAAITTLPFMEDNAGKKQVVAAGSIAWFIAVPKWAENKEEVIKYLDLKLDKDIHKGAAIGEEGVHHKFENGSYFPILPKFNDDLNNASSFLTGVDEKNYPIYWQARVRKDPVLTDAFDTIQANAKGHIVTEPLAFAPPLDAIAKNTQKLNKFMEDTFIRFIAGGESLDNYDKFVSQWKADGGADMIKEANEWYATSKK